MALRSEKASGPDKDRLLRMQLAYDVAKMGRQACSIGVKWLSRQRREPT
jgi:hypothetical protein